MYSEEIKTDSCARQFIVPLAAFRLDMENDLPGD